MSKQIENYFEKQTEAKLSWLDQHITITFQRAKTKLNDELEVNLLKSISPEFEKEFELTDDQLVIQLHPPEYFHRFQSIHLKSTESRWQLAYNITRTIQKHSLERLMLVICPDNIMFDHGLTPHFLHYGVKESIPPYESDLERLLLEVKATVATCVDDKYEFESYHSHYETINLSPVAKEIMESESMEQLIAIIEENLKQDEEYEKTVIHIPKKKWKISRYIILGLLLLLIPSFFYTVFAAFFKIPQTEAYVEANRYFLQDQYSSVIDTLESYDEDDMPYVVNYQLALSYLTYESLSESQRRNILNTITLQSDRRYFSYWIHVGRGEHEEAIDIARILESRDLIMYGLLKQREELRADHSLSGEEREEKMNAINLELSNYESEMEEERKEQETLEEQENEEIEAIPSDAEVTDQVDSSETEQGIEDIQDTNDQTDNTDDADEEIEEEEESNDSDNNDTENEDEDTEEDNENS